jgi:PAS domain S-box-containing protein
VETGLTGQVIGEFRSVANLTHDQQWQALLDSAGEGIWGVDLDGACTFVNRMATQIFGYCSGEMLGKNMHALVHHHHADGSEYLDADCPIYGVFRNGHPVRHQIDTMFRKDGSCFLAEMSAQPVTVDGSVAGVVVTFRDISERHREQQELRRAYDVAEQRTAELDAVIESLPHGVFIATPDGKVRSNRLAREMTGESFPPRLRTLERALSGEASSETIHKEDSWIHSVAVPVLLNGQILGGVAVNTDITQTRMQDEMLRKSEKLAAVGQLASSIAHEINNPLESITNLLYLVRNSSDMEEIQEYAKSAEQELARVSEITLQTLRFHRQQNKPSPVDLAELAAAIVSLYTGRFLVRGIVAESKMTPAPTVMCLEGEVRQVLNNLIRNAVDAMSTGGRLCARVRPGSDHRRGARGREGVRITIADTGEGISPQILEHLFEPFHTTKDVTGTGLGLWVSKGIIDKHGGTILVRTRRSAPRGTVFSLWLPLDGQVLCAAMEQGRNSLDSPAHA